MNLKLALKKELKTLLIGIKIIVKNKIQKLVCIFSFLCVILEVDKILLLEVNMRKRKK